MKNQNPKDIVRRINEYIARHSGFESRRDYVSLSHLGECRRRIVREYREGFEAEAHTHHMAYAGYEQERNLRELLRGCGLLEKEDVEVICPFDGRLRGHLDGILGGRVVELKSVSGRQWEKLTRKEDRVLWRHFVQAQMYMRYSGKMGAVVIYRNRDTYEHMAIAVPYNREQADKFEEKAMEILKAIDDGSLPECECGHCKE